MNNANVLPFPKQEQTEVQRLTRSVEVLRHSNTVQREAKKEAAIEAEVAILQTYRAWARPWEQRAITEAIDALWEGNRFPECAPMDYVLHQMREAKR